jgi:hypothetical protein
VHRAEPAPPFQARFAITLHLGKKNGITHV